MILTLYQIRKTEFELVELVKTSLAEEELIQLAKTGQSLPVNPGHLGRRTSEEVPKVWIMNTTARAPISRSTARIPQRQLSR